MLRHKGCVALLKKKSKKFSVKGKRAREEGPELRGQKVERLRKRLAACASARSESGFKRSSAFFHQV